MAERSKRDSYRGSKNPAVAPVACPTAFVWGVPAVCGPGDPIGEDRWTVWCLGSRVEYFRPEIARLHEKRGSSHNNLTKAAGED